MKKYLKSHTFDNDLIYEAIMGPSPLYFAEELGETMRLEKGMKVLDLGCGMGLSSLFLAKEYGVTVFAADLWIEAADNLKRIRRMGLEDKIIPIHADANNLPFADGYFDALVCIDSYQYYGIETSDFFKNKIAKLLKPKAQLGFAFAGFSVDLPEMPKWLLKYFLDDGSSDFHGLDWWKNHFESTGLVNITDAHLVEDGREIWYEWAKIARERNNFDDDKMLDSDKDKILALMTLTMQLK